MLRNLLTAALLSALSFIAAGCGSISQTVSEAMSDTMPQWAGGPPADLPPRPGDPRYEDFRREQMERSLTSTAQAWPIRESARERPGPVLLPPPPRVTRSATGSAGPLPSLPPRPVVSASAGAIY